MDGNTLTRPTDQSNIVFAIEDFCEAYEDSIGLTTSHFEELEDYKGELDPDYTMYKTINDAGYLKTLSVRCDEQLVGYCLIILSPSLHFKGILFATSDVIYLAPEFRRFDIAVRFIKFIEKVAKNINVDYLTFGVRPKRDYSSLLKRLGYTQREIVYHKEL